MPPADDNKTAAQRELEDDCEIGKIALRNKNYRGAEFRFRDALFRQPDNPDASFGLAQSLEHQRKNEEAISFYRSYLKLQPAGRHAQEAQKHLHILVNKSCHSERSEESAFRLQCPTESAAH
jgi:hypothetical protein